MTANDFNISEHKKPQITVVAALIWRDGKFLACRRPQNKSRALLWEFVGGKVERGETKRQALVRECEEELAIAVKVGKQFYHTVHSYDDVTVDLTLFNAEILSGEPTLMEHAELRWITPDQTDELEFCPADAPVLQKIKTDFGTSDC
ncbi:MAG: (deoxy)nucleoside triphosphate pyrophosphohydrolase [Corallococcus sp.]|nr:(deoxy)nucleoside triphosphate pyrophosphohydrolase [Corallococcus sp.]MCM1360065.1 (deoxy)nucleoside triphosphate pyrophosphohydrolase [Corallococcus sp.]MCM1395622.1 (deoxy)nucleoside triphosphate pyrophosphohydrolase [Corallococcus sp.]